MRPARDETGDRHGMRTCRLRAARCAAAVLVVAVVSAACSSSSGGTSGTEVSSPQSSSHTAASSSSSAAPMKPTGPALCPNVEGGSCLGDLFAGTEYATQVFHPQLTYSVPIAGWSNYEDTPGNFLLVPPQNDLPGVNAGTSDFLGVYTAISPSRIVEPEGCSTELLPDAGASPEAMASWFQQQPDLDATQPAPVQIDGLQGVVIDLRSKPAADQSFCIIDGKQIDVAGLFSGVPPSSLDHAVIPGMTMRLYLLAFGGKVLGIELDDIDSAPGDLAQLSSVATSLKFAS